MNKNIDFVNGNTKKCLLEMTVPMIIAMFLNMAYNLVDSLWIGNLLGEQAYAALTNSTPIILILTSIGMGATNGLAILLSQVIGEYSCAMKSHFRKFGNQMSGSGNHLCNYASLLA